MSSAERRWESAGWLWAAATYVLYYALLASSPLVAAALNRLKEGA